MIFKKKHLFILLILTVLFVNISISFASNETCDNIKNSDSLLDLSVDATENSEINDNNLKEDVSSKNIEKEIRNDKNIKTDGQKSTGIAFSRAYRDANQTVDITATLRSGGVGIPNERLTVKYNNLTQTFITDKEGKINHIYSVTQPGLQIINITYAGSNEYKACNRTETFMRSPSASLIRISLSNNICCVDQTVVISARLVERNETPIPNETMLLTLNNKTYKRITDSDGYANITYYVKEAKMNNLTVIHEASEMYAQSYNYKMFETHKWGTSTYAWTSYDSSASTFHVRITLYADGQILPGEKMRLRLNDNETQVYTDSEGIASTIFKLQDRGDQTLYINFDETNKYKSTNRTKSFSSYTYNTTLDTVVNKTAKIGEILHITAQLNYTSKTGSVKLSNEPVTICVNNENFTGKTDNKGQYTINYTPTKQGTLNIISYYNNGQFKFNISQSKKISVKVEENTNPRSMILNINAPKTMVTGRTAKLNITATDLNKKSVNASVILKINGLTQKDNSGSVIILDVKNGKASYNLPLTGFSAKSYNLTVVSVDKNHDRTENSSTMIVTRGKCSIKPISINASSEEEITINTVVKDNYGTVISGKTQIAIKLGDRTVLTTKITDGKINVKVKVPFLPPGENKFIIILGENYRYEQNIINNTLNIHKQNVTATISKITSNPGKKITIKTKLINSDTKTNVISGKFSYKLDGQTISTNTNLQVTNAIAQMVYTLPSTIKTGKHTIMIVYAGNTQSNPLRYSSDALVIT